MKVSTLFCLIAALCFSVPAYSSQGDYAQFFAALGALEFGTHSVWVGSGDFYPDKGFVLPGKRPNGTPCSVIRADKASWNANRKAFNFYIAEGSVGSWQYDNSKALYTFGAPGIEPLPGMLQDFKLDESNISGNFRYIWQGKTCVESFSIQKKGQSPVNFEFTTQCDGQEIKSAACQL